MKEKLLYEEKLKHEEDRRRIAELEAEIARKELEKQNQKVVGQINNMY